MKSLVFLVSVLLLLPLAAFGTSQPEKAPGPKELVFSMEIGSDKEVRQPFFAQLVKDYMTKNPGVNIKFEPVLGDYDEYITKLLVSLRGGVGPDIFTTTGSTLLKFAETGMLVPGNPAVEAFVKKEALNEGVLLSATGRDGKIYGIPWRGDWPALFYNVAMYGAAGIGKPPANWEELVSSAQKLTKKDAQGNVQVAGFFLRKSGAKLGTFEKWYPFFTAAGGRLYNAAGTQCTVNGPEGREALQFYVDLMHKYGVDSFKLPQGDTNGFISGNVAQYIREPGNIARFRTAAPNLRFGTAVIPSAKATARGIANIDSAVVTKNSKHPDTAWDFLLWMSSAEVATRRDKTLFLQPLLKSVAQDQFFKDSSQLAPFLKQEADVFPLHPSSFDIENALGKAVETALQQTQSVQAALDEAAKAVDGLLK